MPTDPTGTAQEPELIERMAWSLFDGIEAQSDGRWPISTSSEDGDRTRGLVDHDINFVELASFVYADALQSRIAEVSRLREALKPFAECAERIHETASDARQLDAFTEASVLVVGDLREARAALSLHRRPT